jgi:hypothetical protein
MNAADEARASASVCWATPGIGHTSRRAKLASARSAVGRPARKLHDREHQSHRQLGAWVSWSPTNPRGLPCVASARSMDSASFLAVATMDIASATSWRRGAAAILGGVDFVEGHERVAHGVVERSSASLSAAAKLGKRGSTQLHPLLTRSRCIRLLEVLVW